MLDRILRDETRLALKAIGGTISAVAAVAVITIALVSACTPPARAGTPTPSAEPFTVIDESYLQTRFGFNTIRTIRHRASGACYVVVITGDGVAITETGMGVCGR